MPDHFHEPAITRRLAFGYHHTVERAVLRTRAPQTNYQHAASNLASTLQHSHQAPRVLHPCHAAHRLEHLPHLGELLEHAVHFFHRGAAAFRDALAAAAIDDRVVAPFGDRHRTDDRFDASDLALINVLP